jgi:hypothetical protein
MGRKKSALAIVISAASCVLTPGWSIGVLQSPEMNSITAAVSYNRDSVVGAVLIALVDDNSGSVSLQRRSTVDRDGNRSVGIE